MEHVHNSTDPRVFVFGSNLRGIHGAGAARYAATALGALTGVNEGRTGRSYALPTCSKPGVPLSLREVKRHVDRFLLHAEFAKADEREYDTRFFVSAVGCGIAGFKESEIAPLFKDAPDNCDLPPGWR